MQHIKDHNTGYLFDPWDYLGSRRRKLLDQSWAGLFRKYLLNELPVDKLVNHFHPSMGRPSKEFYTALGTLILQQLHDLSDNEAVHTLSFDIRWHYALDITGESDKAKTMAERTLRNYRRIVIQEKLEGYLFETLTDKLIDVFDTDTSRQRLDSTHIRSNMRNLGRIGIFAATIKKFLKNLKRQHLDIFDAEIPPQMALRYLKKKDGCFSQVKPSEANKTLKLVSDDLLFLVEKFRDHEAVSRLNSFHLLERVIDEQCIVSDTEDGDKKVEIKPARDVPSDSLQNPSDPDATYDGHKGKGYQVQLMETFVPDDERDKTKPNLITYVEVEPAHLSDAEALMPAIENTAQRGFAPDELQADAAYGSDENVQAAKESGVDVLAPVMGRKSSKLSLADFTFHENTSRVKSCPNGHAPDENRRTKKGIFVARFRLKHCRDCPLKGRCPVKVGKAGAYLRYSDKRLRLANRRVYEESEEFRDRYRRRAGIEGTNSHLKSDTGAGVLRVRGLPSVAYSITLKALGLNILRATSALKSLTTSHNSPIKRIFDRIFVFFAPKFCFEEFSRNIIAILAQYNLSKNICIKSAN